MRFLLDENVSEAIAPAMQALAVGDEEFAHVIDVADGRQALSDDEVVELCRTFAFDALITLNVKDFGAKRHYYTALEQRGIHVVVMRQQKTQPDVYQQMGMICSQFSHVRKILDDAEGPTLVRVNRQAATKRTLDELMAEFDAPKLP